MIKVIVTGAAGQLGWEIQRTAPDDIELIALDRSGLDITDIEQVSSLLQKEQPDWVINTAAYTAVDKAEEQKDLAFQVNAEGAKNLAKACKIAGSKLLQVSTDFVFDGEQAIPYLPTSKTNPLSVYGSSKQKGEEVVLAELGNQCVIIRTSWVYSTHGSNFVKTMLALMAERDKLGIIVDQIGTPTWGNSLAKAIWLIIKKDLAGIYHWSDSGVASWYDFAVAIQRDANDLGLLQRTIPIEPIPGYTYPLLARRPAYSVLDKQQTIEKLGYVAEHWRDALRKMLSEL